jgi:hypothetical protein
MTVIKVSVGLTSKVTNPRNQYENVVFSRTFGHEEPLAPRPDNESDQAAYDEYVRTRRAEIEQELRVTAEESIQSEIDEFYKNMTGEAEEG